MTYVLFSIKHTFARSVFFAFHNVLNFFFCFIYLFFCFFCFFFVSPPFRFVLFFTETNIKIVNKIFNEISFRLHFIYLFIYYSRVQKNLLAVYHVLFLLQMEVEFALIHYKIIYLKHFLSQVLLLIYLCILFVCARVWQY